MNVALDDKLWFRLSGVAEREGCTISDVMARLASKPVPKPASMPGFRMTAARYDAITEELRAALRLGDDRLLADGLARAFGRAA